MSEISDNTELREECFAYLNELRESGETNMFGAGVYLQRYFGLTRYEAKDMVLDWMKNFKG